MTTLGAGWTYLALPGREHVSRIWMLLLVGFASALGLGILGLVTQADRRLTCGVMAAVGAVGLYLWGAMLARRIGLLMANRYTETEYPR